MNQTSFLKAFQSLWHLPRQFMAGGIWVYQKTLSPDHSFWAKTVYPQGYCKFQPTCSEYTRQALLKYGLVKGSFKGLGRIFRCNPWSKGGNDVP